jgi:hypothetical protein
MAELQNKLVYIAEAEQSIKSITEMMNTKKAEALPLIRRDIPYIYALNITKDDTEYTYAYCSSYENAKQLVKTLGTDGGYSSYTVTVEESSSFDFELFANLNKKLTTPIVKWQY